MNPRPPVIIEVVARSGVVAAEKHNLRTPQAAAVLVVPHV
jgi:hypothetical protein